jgi:hypothetical protein
MVADCRKLFGENHRETLNAMASLAQIYVAAGQPLRGLLLLSQVFAKQEEILAPNDTGLVESKKALARVYILTQQFDKVLALCDSGLANLQRTPQPNSTDTLDFLDMAAIACAALKQVDREETYLRELVRVTANLRGKVSEPTSEVMARLANQLMSRAKWETAEVVLRECLNIREKVVQRPHTMLPKWVVQYTRSMLGGALLGQKKFLEAELLLLDAAEKLLAEEGSVPTTRRGDIQQALDRVVMLYTAIGNAEKAAEWRKRTVPAPQKATSP